MAVDRRIWPAGEALLDLVYGLILGIPVANRKLGPLLEIDDDGHRHPGSARPVRDRAESRRSRADREFWSLLGGFAAFDIPQSAPMDYRFPVVENDIDGTSHGGEPRYR